MNINFSLVKNCSSKDILRNQDYMASDYNEGLNKFLQENNFVLYHNICEKRKNRIWVEFDYMNNTLCASYEVVIE